MIENSDRRCVCDSAMMLVVHKKVVSRWIAFFIVVCFVFFATGFFLGKKSMFNTVIASSKVQFKT